MKVLKNKHPHRIKGLIVSLENQKKSLLSFVDVLDDKFKIIAEQLKVSHKTVWEMCVLLRCKTGSDKYVARSVPLLLKLGDESCELLEDLFLLL